MAAVLGVGAAIWVAGAPAASVQPTAKAAKVTVGVEVLHFATAGRNATATGLVTAKLTDNSGHVSTVHTRVALTASAGRNCRVLHLFLKELTLTLLGLRVHLDPVTLDITGQPNGGVLGSLFCKLSRAKVASARASAARSLNRSIGHSGGRALRFTTYIRPMVSASQAAVATCPVLDLVVGPLDLKLLGLVVDLNRVHLVITATRGAGALGDLFCQLADNSTTTAP
jgi:hypothetical protein